MEERKRGYQGRRLAGATPRQEPERRGSRTRQAEDKARRGRDPWEMTPEEKVSPVEATSAEAVQAELREQSVRQVEDKARRERDPWEMTSEETAPITPGDGESVSAGRRAASVAGGKAAPAADFDSMSGSADGASADSAAGAVDSDAMAGPGEGSGSGGAAVKKKKSGFAAFWSDFGYLIVTAVVVVLVFRVILQLSWVPSGSMETTIPKKTLLISWQLPYVVGDPVPERGNIVTFWSDELDKLLVKSSACRGTRCPSLAAMSTSTASGWRRSIWISRAVPSAPTSPPSPCRRGACSFWAITAPARMMPGTGRRAISRWAM